MRRDHTAEVSPSSLSQRSSSSQEGSFSRESEAQPISVGDEIRGVQREAEESEELFGSSEDSLEERKNERAIRIDFAYSTVKDTKSFCQGLSEYPDKTPVKVEWFSKPVIAYYCDLPTETNYFFTVYRLRNPKTQRKVQLL